MTRPENSSAISRSTGLKQQGLGIGLIVLSTVAIAVVPSLAKLAYEGGSNTLTVITGRSIFSVVVALTLLMGLRQPLAIPRGPLVIALITGLGYAVILYGYLGAVNYLPVNQVILIYFIHPLLVGLITMFLGHERLTWMMASALIAALLGLCLAIGLSFQSLDALEIGLATIAMVVTALVVVANARALTGASAISIGFFMMLSAAIALAILFALFGSLALPTTTLGWTGFIGVAVAATTGTLSFIGGMAYVGATRAAMITNFELVLGVLFALAVLKERISFYQGVGIAVVIGSIFAMELQRAIRAPQPSREPV